VINSLASIERPYQSSDLDTEPLDPFEPIERLDRIDALERLDRLDALNHLDAIIPCNCRPGYPHDPDCHMADA